MEAFLLPDSHDRIRSFREALRSGPGLMVKRDRAKELDFWEWEISRVKDLSAHKIYREKIGLADRSRWLTGWNTRGRKELAPSLWPELFDCWNMRRLDMIDCFAGAASKYLPNPDFFIDIHDAHHSISSHFRLITSPRCNIPRSASSLVLLGFITECHENNISYSNCRGQWMRHTRRRVIVTT